MKDNVARLLGVIGIVLGLLALGVALSPCTPPVEPTSTAK